MEAAKGNITTEKKDNNIASKIENITKKWITSRHYHVKKWMENRNTPGKEGRKNYGPNRSNAAKRLEKNRRRNDRNAHGLQQWRTKIKIKFIYHI